MDTQIDPATLLACTSEIVATYAANNDGLDSAGLVSLISQVHEALRQSASSVSGAGAEAVYQPAISVRRSVTNDKLFSLIDGKPYSSLKRHLRTNGLTPDEYRARYKLPADYPMVAPGYSARRSEMAKSNGLGVKPGKKRGRKPAAKG